MVVFSHRPMFLRGRLQDDPASLSDAPGFFLAHELAHQWWGHGVAGENYHERWLSEGFAQYAALLWLRESHGEEAFRDALRRMGRWVRRFAAAGPISLGYRLGHLQQDHQVYRAIVYDKGAYVLHMLRGLVGEDAFRAALASLLDANRFGKIGTDDLREALEAAAGRELAPYVEEWVRGTRLPRLQVSHASAAREGGGYRTWVTVQAEGLPGPVPLAIAVDGDGREPRRVTLPPGGGRYEIDTPQRIGRVLVNEDHGLLLGRD
jgi:aminopeptidase N